MTFVKGGIMPKEDVLERERLDRRADAMVEFVVALADAGDEKAVAFLNKLWGGGFDFKRDNEASVTIPRNSGGKPLKRQG